MYDPRDPVMTLYTPTGQQEPHDQRPLDWRRDVLVYRTAPLTDALEVTARYDAAVGGLDGERYRLRGEGGGSLAGRLRAGAMPRNCARPLPRFAGAAHAAGAGLAYEYSIAVNPTSNLFRRGHRLEVHVSSSDFPNFDRNHNTGGNDYAEAALVTARQTVFHDAARPSRVILPVIP